MEFARGNLIQFSAVSCRNCRQNPAAEILLYNNYAGSETEGEVHWRRSSCVSGGARDSRQNPVAEILLCFKRDQRQRAKSIGCNLALFQAGPETAGKIQWRRSYSVLSGIRDRGRSPSAVILLCFRRGQRDSRQILVADTLLHFSGIKDRGRSSLAEILLCFRRGRRQQAKPRGGDLALFLVFTKPAPSVGGGQH